MKKVKRALSARNLTLIWVLGMAGQICWNLENQWFNTFVYAKIAGDPSIIAWMVGVSAAVTTFSTFFFGTVSDRMGKRKPMIVIGYIIWGLFTMLYGFTEFIPHTMGTNYLMVASIMVVMADAIMSFFGSLGNDAGFNAWISDTLNDENKGAIGTALAVQPVLGTIIGTVIGGMIIAAFGYLVFFIIMGLFVMAVGVISIFTLKEKAVKPHRIGTFWQQFASAFNFKRFFAMKELWLVNLVVAIYFIGFNVYFVHIGNMFIYNFGFDEGTFGIVQGLSLIIAIAFTIPASHFIRKNQSAQLLIATFIINIVGLVILYAFAGSADGANLLSPTNFLLYFGILLIGVGYILTMQTTMVWVKQLYPEEARGQFEGVRIIFYVLIPMVFGPMIANPFITRETTMDYGLGPIPIKVPEPNLFLIASIVMLVTFIPLFFLTKIYMKRIKEEAQKIKELPLEE